jgi:hypothetical protein
MFWTLFTSMVLMSAPSVPPAAARPTEVLPTVSGSTYLEEYGATSRIKVWRSVSADIVVRGTFLDLSTGVEVRTANGAAATGVTASIVARQGGPNTRITVRVSSTNAAALGDYRVLIRYPVETNGPDRIDLRLFNRGEVTALRIEEPPQINPASGARYVLGETYTLAVEGSRLTDVRLASRFVSIVSRVSTSASQARFRIKFNSAGPVSLRPADFYDGAMSSAPSIVQSGVATFAGTEDHLFTGVVGILPVITSFSPSNPTVFARVTVNGTGLLPKGYLAVLRFRRLYGAPGSNLFTTEVTQIGGVLTFVAPADAAPTDIEYSIIRDGSSPADEVVAFGGPAPRLDVSGEPPVLQRMTVVDQRDKVLFTGSQVLLGKHFSQAAVVRSVQRAPTVGVGGISGVPGGINQGVPTMSLTTLPSVRFSNSAIPVTAVRYSATAQVNPIAVGSSPTLQGVDSLYMTVPALPDTMTGALSVTTSAGTTTFADVFYVPAPTVSAVKIVLGNGQLQTVSNTTLIRGRSYRLAGTALAFRTSVVSAPKVAIVTLNGVRLPTTSFTDGVGFSVPATASSGALTVTTIAGTTTVGTFAAVDPERTPALAGIVLSPSSVAGGSAISAAIAVNGVIPAGGSAGTIVLFMQPRDPDVLLPTGPIAITSNPLDISIPTRAVAAARTVQIIARTEGVDPNNSSVVATLTLRPPRPTALVLGGARVTGGQPVTATVQLNTTVAASASIPITLLTSDPTSATVPATVSANGNTATFTIVTPVVPAERVVTISATSDGQTVTANLTVLPPIVSTLTLAKASTVAQQPDTATLTFSAPLPASTVVSITCEDPALVCPPSLVVSGTSAKFAVGSRPVPSARTVGVTATLNGASKTATLTLVPSAVQSVTISPASTAAGTQASMTIQLNAPRIVGSDMTIRITSDRVGLVSTTDPIFQTGDAVKIVALRTVGPQPQANTVTFTVTLTYSTPFGPATSTNAATLVITP